MKFVNSPFAIQEKRINSLDKKRNLIYEDDLGKDEVLEMRYKGKRIVPGQMLKKTSAIDLVLGNGTPKLN